jgi:hypothetical protein
MSTQVQNAFNQVMNDFVNTTPDSDASKAIKLISSLYPETKSYYEIFHRFCDKLNISFFAAPYDIENTETDTYIPCIKYDPGNLLNEEVRLVEYTKNSIDLIAAYRILAKELLYLLMKRTDLESLNNNIPKQVITKS